MTTLFHSQGMLPGPQAALETAENSFAWGPGRALLFNHGAIIDGATRDTGNTGQTTTLRPGLLLGKVTSSGKYKQYNPGASDGTQVVAGILAMQGLRATDIDGNNRDLNASVVVGGPVQASKLFTGASPYTLDYQARQQMRAHFTFDDDIVGNLAYPWKQEVAKAASYTVVAGDNGTLFTTLGATGAVTFTLPALVPGLVFGFLNLVDQNMIIASAEGDNIVWVHDAAADSLTFSTSSQKIGAFVRVYSNAAGTKWYVESLSSATITVTPAS